MAYSRFISSKFLLFLPLLFVLVIAVACGDDATPVVIEKEGDSRKRGYQRGAGGGGERGDSNRYPHSHT